MTEKDKDLLVAKIDTLRMSINDNQLDTILSILKEVVTQISTNPDKVVGFKQEK